MTETQQGYIYFLTDGEAIKIGFAKDPVSRLSELQVSHHFELVILATIASPKYREKILHQRFQKHHIRGEWFWIHQDILDLIDDMDETGQVIEFETHVEDLRRKNLDARLAKIDARRRSRTLPTRSRDQCVTGGLALGTLKS